MKAFHATLNDRNQVGSILAGIDPQYLSWNSRFGRAFYVSDEPETALAELRYHGADPTHVIQYSMNPYFMRVLDLTHAKVAKKFHYAGGPITTHTQAIGVVALGDGFNVIRFFSEHAPGKINHAILDNFPQILRPEMVVPAKK